MSRARHVHILNPQAICCPEHLYEMAVVLFNQRKYDQLQTLISNILQVLDTRFLLDTSSLAVTVKRTLAAVINKTAVHSISLADFNSALEMLEIAETVLGSTIDSGECMAYLSSTYSNLAHCYAVLGDLGRALDYADKSLEISRKAGDVVGTALGRIAKASLLTEAGTLVEAAAQAREAVKALDPYIEQFLKKEVDAALVGNKRFLSLLQLQIAACVREIAALRMTNTAESLKSAEEKQAQTYRLAQRFLPEDHELVLRLKTTIQPEKTPVKVRITKGRPPSASHSLSDSINSRVEADETLAEVMAKPPIRRPTPKRVRKPIESLQTQSVPELPFTPPKVIRLPDDCGPIIPFRPCARRHCFRFDLSRDWERVDATFLLESKRKYVIMPDGTRVTQVIPSNGDQYRITCGIQVKQSATYLSITGVSESTNSIFVTPESLEMKELEGIVNMLAFKDIAPATVHMKFITSFERFAQYMLFPFLRVTEGEGKDAGKKIELWGQAAGLLPGQHQRHLFNTSCNVTLHALTLTALRLVISDAAEEEYKDNCLRVDIEYDQEAAAAILPQPKGTEGEPGLLRRTIPSLAQVNAKFLRHLEPVLTEIELMGKDQFGPDVVLKTFLAGHGLFMLNVTVKGRNLHQTLWTLRENVKQNSWEIRAKPLVSRGDSTRNGEAFHTISFLDLTALFAVRIDNLEIGERRLLAKLYLNSLHVDVPAEGSDLEAQPEIHPPLVEIVLATRSLLTKDNYKVPVTLSLMGLSGQLVGIKATVHNLSISFDYGCFFYIDMRSFSIKSSVSQTSSEVDLLEVVETETNLLQLLEKNEGWRTILNSLQFKQFRSGLRMVITDRTGRTSLVDSLDNVLFRSK